jgi:hypothetical protein
VTMGFPWPWMNLDGALMVPSDHKIVEQLIDRIGLRGVIQLIWEICRKKGEADPRTYNYPAETLEYIIDQIALSGALDTIAGVCWTKSEHIGRQRVRLEDETTSQYKFYAQLENRWVKMAERLEKIAESSSSNLGGGEIEIRTP